MSDNSFFGFDKAPHELTVVQTDFKPCCAEYPQCDHERYHCKTKFKVTCSDCYYVRFVEDNNPPQPYPENLLKLEQEAHRMNWLFGRNNTKW